MNNYIDLTQAFDIMYGEERRMEIEEVKSAQRNEKTGVLTKEYFKDVGTFFEWIQGIEIDENEDILFSRLHKCLTNNHEEFFGVEMRVIFLQFCENKAIEEIDDE